MRLTIPDYGLVVLMGAAGAGKTTFAARHFRPSEVLSSDHYREVVGDDDRSPRTTRHAFEVITEIARRRLAARRVAVIDATNVERDARARFVELARAEHAPLTAIALDLPEAACQAQNAGRRDPRPARAVRHHCRQLARSFKSLSREGFRRRYRLHTPEEAAEAEVEREPLACDRQTLHGPFDIVGDVHGCLPELLALLDRLGYRVETGEEDGARKFRIEAPEGRTLVFVGDVVDRGPDSAGALALVMDAVDAGCALALPGNHDVKLARALAGRDVERKHGLAETMAQIGREPQIGNQASEFIPRLPSHYVLDGGRLVVAHAGLKEAFHNRVSADVRSFALYGDTTGETDAEGLPVRLDWARDYRGAASVVYGHTPVAAAEWVNATICIDTGCVFGGELTALRYPEGELVSVRAERAYAEPPAALAAARSEASRQTRQQASDELLDAEDLLGKLRIHTPLMGNVFIAKDQSAAALDVMSRFAVDPRWLVYLPPTMAPCDASTKDGLLEHPAEAFGHFRARGVRKVTCQEKHMGSRAVVIVAKTREAARLRFGVESGEGGIVYTRTGRRFFDDRDTEREVLDRIRLAASEAELWNESTPTGCASTAR